MSLNVVLGRHVRIRDCGERPLSVFKCVQLLQLFFCVWDEMSILNFLLPQIFLDYCQTFKRWASFALFEVFFHQWAIVLWRKKSQRYKFGTRGVLVGIELVPGFFRFRALRVWTRISFPIKLMQKKWSKSMVIFYWIIVENCISRWISHSNFNRLAKNLPYTDLFSVKAHLEPIVWSKSKQIIDTWNKQTNSAIPLGNLRSINKVDNDVG